MKNHFFYPLMGVLTTGLCIMFYTFYHNDTDIKPQNISKTESTSTYEKYLKQKQVSNDQTYKADRHQFKENAKQFNQRIASEISTSILACFKISPTLEQ